MGVKDRENFQLNLIFVSIYVVFFYISYLVDEVALH